MAKVRVIGLWSHKGGTGKSTLALSIAGGLADRGHRVQLFDADPQRTSSFVANKSDLPFGVITDEGQVDRGVDYIVVDYPPAMEGKDIAGSNDMVVIPFNPTVHDYHAAMSGVSTLVGSEPKIMVLNNFNPRFSDQVQLRSDIMDRHPDVITIQQRSAFQNAMNRNTTVYQLSPSNSQRIARGQVDDLIDAIFEKLGGQ